MTGELSIKERVMTLPRSERDVAITTIKITVDEDGVNYRFTCKLCGTTGGKWAKRLRAADVGVAHWMEKHRG